MAWFVLAAVEEMDLYPFYVAYGVRAIPRPRPDAQRAAAGRPLAAQALHAAGSARGPDQHHRSGLTVVKGLRGFIQGYNAQAVTNEHQIVLAAEIMTVGGDFGHLEPMLDAASRELAGRRRRRRRPRCCSPTPATGTSEQMERVIAQGIQVLIPPDTSRTQDPAAAAGTGGRYDFMRRVLATERGGELYRKRQPMIEPVFAQMKFNRGLDRFKRRGRAAVRTEWRLITATHNLLKLHRHALATA